MFSQIVIAVLSIALFIVIGYLNQYIKITKQLIRQSRYKSPYVVLKVNYKGVSVYDDTSTWVKDIQSELDVDYKLYVDIQQELVHNNSVKLKSNNSLQDSILDANYELFNRARLEIHDEIIKKINS